MPPPPDEQPTCNTKHCDKQEMCAEKLSKMFPVGRNGTG